MIDKRKEIVMLLNQPQKTSTLYTQLKCCLILDTNVEQRIADINPWFDGVISSLFYKPNMNVLNLIGPQGIGKTEFFRRLLPNNEWFTDVRSRYCEGPNLYEYLLTDMTEFTAKTIKNAVSNEGFKIVSEVDTYSEKRLASIGHTSNVKMFKANSMRRRRIDIQLIDIDKQLFNSIDKEALWIEIFNNYIYENRITQFDISERFSHQ